MLEVRKWTCPRCNSHDKRDVNAAKNILAVGLSVIAFGDTSGGIIKTGRIQLLETEELLEKFTCTFPIKMLVSCLRLKIEDRIHISIQRFFPQY